MGAPSARFLAVLLAAAGLLAGCVAPSAAPDRTDAPAAPPSVAGTTPAPASSSASSPATGPAPSAPAGGAVHFTAAGDFGSSRAAAAVLAKTAALKPDFALVVGDLSYGEAGGERDWCSFVTAAVGHGFPFELVSGNHESDGENGSIEEFVKCLPNRLPGLVGIYGRQWYVDVPRDNPVLRLVMISPGLDYPGSSDTDYAPGSRQYRWTADTIDSARAAGIPWVVVGTHLPCYSMGKYDCEMGQDMADLLVQKKVDLVLNGHEHLYQRTYQLGPGPGCAGLVAGTADTACIRDKSGTYEAGAGTVFATVGTGGKDLRDIDLQDEEAPYFAAWSAANADPAHGLLDVRATRTELSARFVPATGSFSDAFTLTRH